MIIISILFNCDSQSRQSTPDYINDIYNYIKREFDNKCKLIIIPVTNQPTEIKIIDTNNNFSLYKLEQELYKVCNTNNKLVKNSLKNILRYIKIKKITN